jgi:hypothetical protein
MERGQTRILSDFKSLEHLFHESLLKLCRPPSVNLLLLVFREGVIVGEL